ncbi:hypothetical protein KIN20_016805 [Parelaphostrongylus tenuis]|uniref:Uncharacterized protein n=1 Tax=Parelaphostrongylus tenuis TaxID=148309 RepID=A0AAD5N5R9_PARTN|nr:hypothetical protein KIN20_016805 [Parelaphostrongylus tenuis]
MTAIGSTEANIYMNRKGPIDVDVHDSVQTVTMKSYKRCDCDTELEQNDEVKLRWPSSTSGS